MTPVAEGESARSGLTTNLGLLECVRKHEPGSWTQFVALYTPLLCYWFRRAGVPAQDHADLVQDVFLGVCKGLVRFQHSGDRASFRGWLRRIARNKFADLCRARARTPIPFEALDITADPPDDREEDALIVKGALNLIRTDFDESTWQAFLMRVVENRSAADIAAALGITQNAVYLSKSRVLRRLRDEFGGKGGTGGFVVV